MERSLRILALLTLFLTAADHWTTFLCLRGPISGWQVTEANPIADWLFRNMGLLPGLILDSVVTVAAVAFLLTTRLIPSPAKGAILTVVVAWTGYAVFNNMSAIATLGLSPLGII